MACFWPFWSTAMTWKLPIEFSREIAVEFRLDADHRARPALTGSVSERSTARPPASCMRTVILALSSCVVEGSVGERDVEGRLAVLVERLQVFERHAAVLGRFLVGEAEEVALVVGAFARRLQRRLRLRVRDRRPARHRDSGHRQ